MDWTRGRGQRARDAGLQVTLEEAYTLWLEVLDRFVASGLNCRATREELRGALENEKRAPGRSQSVKDLGQVFTLEDAHAVWLATLEQFVAMGIRCRATREEVKEALAKEERYGSSSDRMNRRSGGGCSTFLAAVGGVGMLAGVKVILVTRDGGLENAVLLLRGMRVVAAKSSVAHLVEYLHDRDQVRFSQ
ncbi:hypothetical protein DFQ27_006988 [Actinomortierella ambigua]|uniref:Uncharacterized protein n=1 Tax=Actinomortierella ambigua TaxID=1343610 RepID=A0A9P6PWW8_9FUNG|nr:hypothetical protein DFQ27_006988 [Actinomortierella ambigua]